MLTGLVGAGDFPKGDCEPVPTVDRDDCQREVHELFFREMLTCAFESLIGNMCLSHARHALSPRQRSPFALRKERRLTPGIKRVKPLLRFAASASVFRSEEHTSELQSHSF